MIKPAQSQRVSVKVWHDVTISDTQTVEITVKTLKNLIGLQNADSLVIRGKKLFRIDDWGHHRGGVTEEEVREATETDIAVVRLIDTLTEINKK